MKEKIFLQPPLLQPKAIEDLLLATYIGNTPLYFIFTADVFSQIIFLAGALTDRSRALLQDFLPITNVTCIKT
jgi:hypothetical protein